MIRYPLLLLLLAPPLAAQTPFEACRDRADRLIPGVVDTTVKYAGLATIRDGRPIIVWNAKANQHLSGTEQIFIYLHECAHHRLGHLAEKGNDRRWELEADCWAIQLMVDGGMIKGRHLASLEKSRRSVPGDRAHLGGEAHVRSLRDCLEVRTDRKAWGAALDTLLQSAAGDFESSRGRLVDSLTTPPVYESKYGTPGTYDCEMVARAVRCSVFASRETGAAEGRYVRLVGILQRWLPPGWTSTERAQEGGKAWLAQDSRSGTIVSLVQAGSRVHFLVKRGEA